MKIKTKQRKSPLSISLNVLNVNVLHNKSETRTFYFSSFDSLKIHTQRALHTCQSSPSLQPFHSIIIVSYVWCGAVWSWDGLGRRAYLKLFLRLPSFPLFDEKSIVFYLWFVVVCALWGFFWLIVSMT